MKSYMLKPLFVWLLWNVLVFTTCIQLISLYYKSCFYLVVFLISSWQLFDPQKSLSNPNDIAAYIHFKKEGHNYIKVYFNGATKQNRKYSQSNFKFSIKTERRLLDIKTRYFDSQRFKSRTLRVKRLLFSPNFAILLELGRRVQHNDFLLIIGIK